MGHALIFILGIAWCIQIVCPAGAAGPATPVPGQVAISRAATRVGVTDARRMLTVAVSLKPRDPLALENFLQQLYDPSAMGYHQFLTPAQFTARFFDAGSRQQVADYLRSVGLSVTDTGVGSIIDANGSVAQLEQAFHLTLSDYRDAAGALFVANDVTPALPDAIETQIVGVLGLDTAAHYHPHFVRSSGQPQRASSAASPQAAAGCSAAITAANAMGGYTPNQVASAYDLTALGASGVQGQGQTVALMELDDFQDGAVGEYQSCFGTAVPVTRVPVDGGATRGGGEGEVELDIDILLGMAPKLASILVYGSANTDAAVVDQYRQIANENHAHVVSTSWGLCEGESAQSTLAAENVIFQQMAAQGQSIFAAAGDTGSEDCDTPALGVDDPASQPFVTGVGGTILSLDSTNAFLSEAVWNDTDGAGGGGVSAVWAKPAYQTGPGTANRYSTGHRQVPDLAAMAAPTHGYLVITYDPAFCTATAGKPTCFEIIGGTSAGSPLSAAETALINQTLSTRGKPPIGFMNPALYAALGNSPHALHDITSGSNCFIGPSCGTPRDPTGIYPATAGYDQATGVGSIDVGQFVTAMIGGSAPSVTASPQQVPFGQNSTTLTFSTGNGSSGTVCVAGNGGAETSFAGGASGSPQATFINSGIYVFTLHAGATCAGAPLASVTVTKLNPKGTTGPAILATPASFSFATATIASTQLVRSSTISFDTGDGSVGQVMLAVNGSTPQLFTASQFGSVTAPWIFSGSYTFTLVKGGGDRGHGDRGDDRTDQQSERHDSGRSQPERDDGGGPSGGADV